MHVSIKRQRARVPTLIATFALVASALIVIAPAAVLATGAPDDAVMALTAKELVFKSKVDTTGAKHPVAAKGIFRADTSGKPRWNRWKSLVRPARFASA